MAGKSVQHKSREVLLFVDVINHFEFPDGAKLLRQALPIAPKLAQLKKRARAAGVPVVYVNDNFGQWRSDASKLLKYCLRPEARGREFVAEISPNDDDYFVLKPMHSAFYQTPLDVLIRYFGARRVILCGVTTNSCIICSAHDAKMRDLDTCIASDCCAARSRREHAHALAHIKEADIGRILRSASIRFSRR